MGNQRGGRGPAEQPDHPCEGHARLLEVGEKLPGTIGKIGHEVEVIDEQGEIADSERSGTHRTRRQQQDQAGAERDDIGVDRVEHLGQGTVAHRCAAALVVQPAQSRDDVALAPCDLDRCRRAENFRQQSGDAARRPTAGAAIPLDPRRREAHQRDNADQRDEDSQGQPRARRQQDRERHDREETGANLIERPTNRVLDLFGVVAKGAQSRAGGFGQGPRTGLAQDLLEEVATQQRAHGEAVVRISLGAEPENPDPPQRHGGEQPDQRPRIDADRRGTADRIEEPLRQQAGQERRKMDQRPEEPVRQIEPGAIAHQRPQELPGCHASTSSPAVSVRNRRL